MHSSHFLANAKTIKHAIESGLQYHQTESFPHPFHFSPKNACPNFSSKIQLIALSPTGAAFLNACIRKEEYVDLLSQLQSFQKFSQPKHEGDLLAIH
jgi:hypothetical protein